MNQLPIAARVYVTAVIAASAAVAAYSLPLLRLDQPLLFLTLLVLCLATATLKVNLPLTTSGSTMSVSYAVAFASLLLLGPPATMIVAAGGALSQCYLNRKEPNPAYRTAFSVAALVIAVEGAGLALGLLRAASVPGSAAAIVGPVVGAATTYFLVNTGLVAAAIALSAGESIATTWHTNFLWSAPSYFIGAGTAAFAAWLVTHVGYWSAPVTFGPLYLTYYAYRVYLGRIEREQRHVEQTSDLHLATVEALARAIDAKDQAQPHLRRLQAYAAGLARAAGLPAGEIQGVRTAALLHDIGNLAVPEHILSKPGSLTEEEFQKIRIHPQVGAQIVASVPFPYPVAPLILGHHERWDGKGYPQQLSGEAIPIGARILSVADYYDALTTERPYHKGMTPESAVAVLRHEAGRALDPRLVDAFLAVLPELKAEYARDERPSGASHEAPRAGGGAGAADAASRTTSRSAFENIALAHREIYALYEIAQAMGTSLGVSDTMALISSKLSKLVPWSGCALFVSDAGTDLMRCRYAAGIDAPRLLNATMAAGTGLSGWMARHRRPLTNADPRATFEAAGIPADTSLASALVCPLTFEDRPIGCLALYHTVPNLYTEDHRRLLERVAEQAGAVLHNSIVFEQTQEESLTDPLTGLPNRRSLFAHLSRELARAERLQSEVALVVMDIDGFKAINDTYGHNIGDRALREVSAALQHTLRPYDLSVRYAGDEFIVVLTGCSHEAADAKRVELQRVIGDIELAVRPGRTVRLGASAGAAVFPHDGATYESLLAEADQRMYADKAARRGRPGLAPPDATPDAARPEGEPIAKAQAS